MEDRLDQIDWQLAWYCLVENSQPMSWNLFLALIPLALSCVLFHQPRSLIVHGGIWLLLLITVLPNLDRFWQLLPLLERFGWWLGIGGSAITLAGLLVRICWPASQKGLHLALWWLGCLVFLLFLPNAAYVLTDVIHFVIDVRKGYPLGTVVLILLPQYLLFIAVGFQAYVAALIHVGYALRDRGWYQAITSTELGLHALSAIGIYLGRFARLNSWDILMDRSTLITELWAAFSSEQTLLVLLVLLGILTVSYWLCKRITIGLLLQKEAWGTYPL